MRENRQHGSEGGEGESPFRPLSSAILWNMKTPKKSSRTSPNGRRNSSAVVQTRTPERVRRPEQRTIHFLTQDELRRLFKVIRSKRDKAIFLAAYRHGLRASEIGLLQRADVDAKQGRVAICLLYTSPSPRDRQKSRMPSSA